MTTMLLWVGRGLSGHLRATLGLAPLLAISLTAAGCASTGSQARYNLREEPEATAWVDQGPQEVWMDIYAGDYAHTGTGQEP